MQSKQLSTVKLNSSVTNTHILTGCNEDHNKSNAGQKKEATGQQQVKTPLPPVRYISRGYPPAPYVLKFEYGYI
jgi:hypothetical protein